MHQQLGWALVLLAIRLHSSQVRVCVVLSENWLLTSSLFSSACQWPNSPSPSPGSPGSCHQARSQGEQSPSLLCTCSWRRCWPIALEASESPPAPSQYQAGGLFENLREGARFCGGAAQVNGYGVGKSVLSWTQCDFSSTDQLYIKHTVMENVCISESDVRNKALSGAT